MSLSTTDKQTIKAFREIVERETATAGDKLTVKGLGTFQRKTTEARTGRNPQTGGTVEIPARSVLRFKASTTTRVDL